MFFTWLLFRKSPRKRCPFVPEDPTGKASIFEEIGAGLFGNKKLQLILGIGGGVAVILAIVLIVAFAKKPKNSGKKENDEDENGED